MINFFMAQQERVTQKKRKIIQKHFLDRRKYNPFHLECTYTKKNLCYCKKHPIAYLTEGQKAELWRNSYMKPAQFFKARGANAEKLGNRNEGEDSKADEKQMDDQQQKPQQIEQAFSCLSNCIKIIKALSRAEVVSFINQQKRKPPRTTIESDMNPASMIQ